MKLLLEEIFFCKIQDCKSVIFLIFSRTKSVQFFLCFLN